MTLVVHSSNDWLRLTANAFGIYTIFMGALGNCGANQQIDWDNSHMQMRWSNDLCISVIVSGWPFLEIVIFLHQNIETRTKTSRVRLVRKMTRFYTFFDDGFVDIFYGSADSRENCYQQIVSMNHVECLFLYLL